ncbi:alpha/beta-hydrolase [Wolfiporia cocos MD-104 SS10]|uniref:triacylglycerol lipase n=1 Tax=Wolfiporia cocos (strain MD-104) TaxID=742152 RepID=A0A2H3J9C2_WOLCO|nr:alpha/beta-hydrolase [Wolfiporia cocos MD-104 SS10]
MRLFDLVPSALKYTLLSLLWPKEPPVRTTSLNFELRHEHGLSSSSRIVFADVQPASRFAPIDFTVGTRRLRTHRPASQNDFFNARTNPSLDVAWEELEIDGPDTEDRETLLTLAKMTSNAYQQPIDKEWYDLGTDWNNSYPFGWEPDEDGFRGHIYATPDNSTVVITVKGTSAGWMVGGGGPTTRKDKLNDNLLFSCCCARVGPTWTPVCDCYEGGYKCDQGCLEKSLVEESLFYSVGTNLYYNVTYMYPNSNIWLVGHSLGGSLASLIAVTFGVPAVGIEAPGDRLPAQRLHLPSPPSTQHVTHVFHTGDPIPMGTCTGVSSSCAIGGFALESRCHLGKIIRYDTVSKLGWSADIRGHGIKVIIDKLLSADWESTEEGGRGVPEPVYEDEDCVDCFNWEFGDFRNVSLTTCGMSN